MTNYDFKEFKAWLEEKPERKAGLHWIGNFTLISRSFKEFIEGKDTPNCAFASSSTWQPRRKIALKWKAEVDQRERERERAGGKQ